MSGRTQVTLSKQTRKRIEEVLNLLESQHGAVRFIPRFDPMEELISCILSQHSADRASFPAFTRLMATYQTWDAIASAPRDELCEVIRKAGLVNQKAKAIQGTLQKIRETFGDYSIDALRDWDTEEALSWLVGLPGVGPKTASIVICFGFGGHAIPVDTHVHRVSIRLGFLEESVNEAKAHKILRESLPPHLAFRYHTDLIQHGRKVCRAPVPRCAECSVRQLCPAGAA